MIYLSNFANKAAFAAPNAVSIAAITPRGFKGEVRKDLAPKLSLVKAAHKGEITMEQFMIEYLPKIYDLDLEEIAASLEGKILLCYCDKKIFCHRTLLGLTLHAELDIEVEEIGGFTDWNAESYALKENPFCFRPPLKILEKYGIEDLVLTKEEAKKQGFTDLARPIISNKWLEIKKRGKLQFFNES